MCTFYLQIEQNVGLVCDHFDIHLGNSYVSELNYIDVWLIVEASPRGD